MLVTCLGSERVILSAGHSLTRMLALHARNRGTEDRALTVGRVITSWSQTKPESARLEQEAEELQEMLKKLVDGCVFPQASESPWAARLIVTGRSWFPSRYNPSQGYAY